MPSFKTYEEAEEFFFEFVDYEKVSKFKYDMATFDLSRVEALMEAVGAPHKAFPAVHVAGTKGKGSTAIMVRSILGVAGKRAGLYTQPHLVDMTERISVDGAPVSRQALVGLANEMQPYVRRVRAETPNESPSFFDLITTAAFRHFAKEAVDFGVVEVGMGGRLDSTNVCRPFVCGITRIDYDHVERLGNTLAKIAWEKAGIIKPGVPVVSAEQVPEAMEAIERVAGERKARLVRVGQDIEVGEVASSLGSPPALRFDLKGLRGDYEGLSLPLLGRHQAGNAAVAVGLAELLADQGALTLTPDIVTRGLADARCPARMEVVGDRPLILLDGAHNVISMTGVRAVLDEHLSDRRIILVFGVAHDKDFHGMLQQILPKAARALLTRSESPRAALPEDLTVAAEAMGFTDAEVFDKANDALDRALELAGPDDVILITGSFYLAGLLRPRLVNANP